jgi:hypothetical protein
MGAILDEFLMVGQFKPSRQVALAGSSLQGIERASKTATSCAGAGGAGNSIMDYGQWRRFVIGNFF